MSFELAQDADPIILDGVGEAAPDTSVAVLEMTEYTDDAPVALSMPVTDELSPRDRLIVGAQAGNMDAMGQLWRDHAEKVRQGAARRLSVREDIEDATSQCAVNMVRSLGTFAVGTNFEGWLNRMGQNAGHDQYRKNTRPDPEDPESRIPRTMSLDDEVTGEAVARRAKWETPTDENPEETAVQTESDFEVQSILAILDPKFRKVFERIAMDGLTYEEYANESGLKMGTVRSQLSRAKAQLATIIQSGIVGADIQEQAVPYAKRREAREQASLEPAEESAA